MDLDEVARRHGFSVEAVRTMLAAVRAGQGGMAQFAHAEFGGSGQWMRGGMTMIGAMFDSALKARVERLCDELARLPDAGGRTADATATREQPAAAARSGWWPRELGEPDAAGAQNEMRYAYFAAARRLAIDRGDGVTVYDTGTHRISGVAQQQSRHRTLAFTSQLGDVEIATLPIVADPAASAPVSGTARCRLRAYRADDADALVRVADDAAVARGMTHAFPHPYTPAAATAWLTAAVAESPVDNFAIEVDGELVGGIGLRPHGGERLGGAELGYWLGRACWGRGIATAAARLCVAYAFEQRGLRRLEAFVFASNPASARVLEKTGFVREGVLRAAYVERDGVVVDGWLYALLAGDVRRSNEPV